LADHRLERVVDLDEPLGQRPVEIDVDHAVRHVLDLRPVSPEHTPAEVPGPRIDADDPHQQDPCVFRGQILCGLSRPLGSNAALRRRWSSMSSAPCSSGKYSAFEVPIPCSPLSVPRIATTARKSRSSPVATLCVSSGLSQRKLTCRFPSPA